MQAQKGIAWMHRSNSKLLGLMCKHKNNPKMQTQACKHKKGLPRNVGRPIQNCQHWPRCAGTKLQLSRRGYSIY